VTGGCGFRDHIRFIESKLVFTRSRETCTYEPLILTRQPGSKSQPVVRRAVNQLRQECIQREPGTLLGQEEELLRRLGISRPTLRQAAALLGQEQLMNVRRGPGGGYFTTRPDISAVVHMAAIWLQLEHVAIGEILASTSTLRRELAPLAALNMDEEGYAKLTAFLEHDRAIDEKDYGFTVFLKAEIALGPRRNSENSIYRFVKCQIRAFEHANVAKPIAPSAFESLSLAGAIVLIGNSIAPRRP